MSISRVWRPFLRPGGYFALALTWTLTAVLLAPPAQGQPTTDQLEGIVGSGTYLDLTDAAAGTTRHGITLIWSNHTDGAWNFPDTSNSSEFVNSNSGDDKEASGGTPAIALDVSGLLPSTSYNIFLAALARNPGNDEGGDISWGSASDMLTTLTYDTANMPPGSFPVDDGTTTFLTLVKAGSLPSDGSGGLSLFVGEGLPFQADPIRNRTQFDGILLSVVPEPGTILIGLLAAAAGSLARRKRVSK